MDQLGAIKRVGRSGFRPEKRRSRLAAGPFALAGLGFTVRDALAGIANTFASMNAAAARMVEAGIRHTDLGCRLDRLLQTEAVLDCLDRFRGPRSDERLEDANAWAP